MFHQSVEERGQIAKGGGLQWLEAIRMEPAKQVYWTFCRFLGRGGERVLHGKPLCPALPCSGPVESYLLFFTTLNLLLNRICCLTLISIVKKTNKQKTSPLILQGLYHKEAGKWQELCCSLICFHSLMITFHYLNLASGIFKMYFQIFVTEILFYLPPFSHFC